MPFLEHRGPTAIIVGIQSPRSALVRVLQSQVHYYRARGFFTVFIGILFVVRSTKSVPKSTQQLPHDMNEVDADRILTTTFDWEKYNRQTHHPLDPCAGSGTVLDWQVATGSANRLSDEDAGFLAGLQAAVIHANYLYTLGFALDLCKRLSAHREVPVVFETHDIHSYLARELGTRNPRTGVPDPLNELIQSEVALANKANVLVHLSQDDLQFFQAALPLKPQFLVYPAIDEKFKSLVNAPSVPGDVSGVAIDLLFVGQWHPANLAAIRWFFEEVWPLITDRSYTLKVIGSIGEMVRANLPNLFDAFCSCFLGPVMDLAPYYRSARCVIAPMRSGTGISIKAIEALALGKPFVGTSKAFRGMPLHRLNQWGIEAHDEPEDFARAIHRALTGELEAAESSCAAYADIFSLQASFGARDQVLRSALIDIPAS